MFRLLVICLWAGFLAASPARALEVAVKADDMGPFGSSNSVWLSGPIVPGDAEKVWAAIRELNLQSPGSSLHVTLDSPGGVMSEGLDLGRVLNKLPELTGVTLTASVGARGGPLGRPGICASACVLAYLGATYRFLPSESRIGVHQFSFGKGGSGITAGEATSVSQIVSAEIIDYLRDARVDPGLFSLMSQTFPEDIHWIARADLKRLKVVNEHVYEQSAEYLNAEGAFYLRLWQQSYWGENKIIAACLDGAPEFVALLQPPDLGFVEKVDHELTVLADGEVFAPATHAVPHATERFASASFTLTAAQLSRFASARSVGARMKAPGSQLFFGFEMELPDTKLKDIIAGCGRSAAASPARPAASPGTSGQPMAGTGEAGMSRMPGFDFAGGDLQRGGVKDISLEACEAMCRAERACQGVSYVIERRWCWPKQELSAPRRAKGVVSSVKE